MSNPRFSEKLPGIIAILRVPIVQNNAFPTSQLKMLIPDSNFPLEKALLTKSGKFFSGKNHNTGIPGFPGSHDPHLSIKRF